MAHNRIPKFSVPKRPVSRVSTSDQKLDMQRNELKRVGDTGRLSGPACKGLRRPSLTGALDRAYQVAAAAVGEPADA